MAKQLDKVQGTIFLSDDLGDKNQSDIYNEMRSIPGVVTVSTKSLGKNKIAVVVKVDSYPYGKIFTEEIHNKIVSEIKEIPGIRKFEIFQSKFVKPEPTQTFDPRPTTSYDDNRKRSSDDKRSVIPSKPQNQGNTTD